MNELQSNEKEIVHIQAVWRGHQARRNNENKSDEPEKKEQNFANNSSYLQNEKEVAVDIGIPLQFLVN